MYSYLRELFNKLNFREVKESSNTTLTFSLYCGIILVIGDYYEPTK